MNSISRANSRSSFEIKQASSGDDGLDPPTSEVSTSGRVRDRPEFVIGMQCVGYLQRAEGQSSLCLLTQHFRCMHGNKKISALGGQTVRSSAFGCR